MPITYIITPYPGTYPDRNDLHGHEIHSDIPDQSAAYFHEHNWTDWHLHDTIEDNDIQPRGPIVLVTPDGPITLTA